MDLYLIRHAEALALGERGITEDEERPLSEEGERQAESLGRSLKKRNVGFDLVLCSPLLRAKQTAAIMLKAIGQTDVRIEYTSGLSPNARPKKLSRYMMKVGGDRVALIGHLPHLAVFAAWLAGGKKAQIEFAKAGVAHMSCGDSPIKGNGLLHWLVTPEWFD